MAYTFVNVQDRALSFNYGTTDRVRMKDFINMAYRDIVSRHRWPWLEASTGVTATAGAVTSASVPADLQFAGRMRPATSATSVEPGFIPWNEYSAQFHRIAPASMTSGVPTGWSLFGNTFYWNMIPSATYSYTFYYWKQPVDLSGDSDVPLIPEKDRDLLVMGALKFASLRDNDMQRYGVFEGQFEGMLAKSWRSTRLAQAESPRKVPMPASYGGAFG